MIEPYLRRPIRRDIKLGMDVAETYSLAAGSGRRDDGRVTATRIRIAVPVAAGLPATRQHTGSYGTAVTQQPS